MAHPEKAANFLADRAKSEWHNQGVMKLRVGRDLAIANDSTWEAQRQVAHNLKKHTLANLAHYLVMFEKEASAHGIMVHWAEDAEEHNHIAAKILKAAHARRVVKSKSMLTEECQLVPHLEAEGFEVTETDLGERIIQLNGDSPSHVVGPAMHLTKEEVSEIFHRELGTQEGLSEPEYLTEAARSHLRQKFLSADAAMTGVNIAVAETGTFVVCTNEGNSALGTSLPKLHIASMGIEKLIPRKEDLALYLNILGRSATGQNLTVYTSHYQRPQKDHAIHIILVDNGRSELLKSADYGKALACIRCGACLNTCPVFRRSGGHSYNSTLPGPIGSLLALADDLEAHASLPYACTQCGSCANVCPVKINLDKQLFLRRQDVVEAGLLSRKQRFGLKIMGRIAKKPKLFHGFGKLVRTIIAKSPRSLLYNTYNRWGKNREMPEAPKQSFRDWYKTVKKDP